MGDQTPHHQSRENLRFPYVPYIDPMCPVGVDQALDSENARSRPPEGVVWTTGYQIS